MLVKKLTKDRVKEELAKYGLLSAGEGLYAKRKGAGRIDKHAMEIRSSRDASPQFSKPVPKHSNNRTTINRNEIKSPSDTTLYTPAFEKAKQTEQANNIINQISDFVENIRIETESQSVGSQSPGALDASGGATAKIHHGSRRSMDPSKSPAAMRPTPEELAKERVDKTILNAEKYRAQINAPTGNVSPNTTQLLILNPEQGGIETDDDFFHMTCHIEATLCEKIERGEFIELE